MILPLDTKRWGQASGKVLGKVRENKNLVWGQVDTSLVVHINLELSPKLSTGFSTRLTRDLSHNPPALLLLKPLLLYY